MNRILPAITLLFFALAIIPQAGAAAAPLVAPTGLAATATSGSEIALSWEANNSPAPKAYSIIRSLSPTSDYVEIAQVRRNVRAYLDMGLAFSTTYYYKIQALATGNKTPSPYSGVAGATTMAGAGDNTPPTVPQNVTAHATTCVTTKVDWSPSSDTEAGVAGYRVFRDGQRIGTTAFNYYHDLNAEGSTSYSYQVEAFDANANVSNRSDRATATTLPCPDLTPPTEPGWISAQEVNCTDVSVSWGTSTDSGSGVAAYQVYLFGYTVALLDSNQTSFLDSHSYYEGFTLSYTVASIDAHGNHSTLAGPASVTLPTCGSSGGNQAPVADAGPDQTSDPGDMVYVNGGGSVDPDGSIDSYQWDFGDGSTGTGRFTGHPYDVAGKYTITLTVTDNEGATDTDTAILDVLAPAGVHDWSTDLGGPGASDSASATAITSDWNGDMAVAGTLSGSVDLGGGTLANNGLQDAFLVMYSSAGSHLWSRSMGSNGNDQGKDVAMDSSGNVFITGIFGATMNAGGDALTSNGLEDVFVAKYSPSGDHLWSWSHGGSGSDLVHSMAVDADGNVIITGTFIGSVNLGGQTLDGAGSTDIFLAKYSSTGTHLWSRALGGPDFDFAADLATDNSGNIILVGNFRSRASFGGQEITSNGRKDAFIASFTSNGQHRWSRGFGGVSEDTADTVTVDVDGSILAAGNFVGAVNFGGNTLPDTGGAADLFLALYTSSGGHLWSTSFGGGGDFGATAGDLALDGNGNFALTGSVVESISFGGEPLFGGGSVDIFIATYNSAGEHLWSRRFGAGFDDYGKGVTCDPDGNTLVTGTFYNSVDFGGGTLESPGGVDTFIVKFRP